MLASNTAGDALIPADLTLQGTDVIDDGLDLDDEQCRGASVEGQQIDPSAPSPVDDRDFPSGLESGSTQSAIHMARAPSVDEVALPAVPMITGGCS